LAEIADGHFRGHRHRQAGLLQVDAGNGDLDANLVLDAILLGDNAVRQVSMGQADDDTDREDTERERETESSKCQSDIPTVLPESSPNARG
jgi:hypothetical protein